MEILDILAAFLRKNIMFVSISIVTTTVAIYGGYIKKALKSVTKKMNFILRFAAYVFVYAFVVGFFSTQAVIFLTRTLGGLADAYLLLITLCIFTALCFMAKSEKQI